MQKIQFAALAAYLVTILTAFAGNEPEAQVQAKSEDDEKNNVNLFAVESNYTFNSDFKSSRSRLGDSDSLYSDFSYDHRFLITGKWYFRAGVEYERYDFNNSQNGLPDHLQASYGHLAVEYVVHDHAGVSIELDPGIYFEDRISTDAFDMPCKAYVTFPIQKDKVFGVIGAGAALYQSPIVAPGGGIIWLINDKMRLQGVFPKPALVYNPNDDWEFRLMGDFVYESFRTDDVITSSRGFRLHDAVVQYNEDRAGVQIIYSRFKPFNVKAGAGYTIRRELDFFRAHEKAVSDPAPYAGLAIEARF